MSKTSSILKQAGLLLGGAVLAGGIFPTPVNRARSDFQSLEKSAAGFSCVRAKAAGDAWVWIPPGRQVLGSRAGRVGEEPREVSGGGFWMAATETTVAEYLEYLKDSGAACASPQVERVDGVWRARVPARMPITSICADEAEAYAVWRGRRAGASLRLPREDEWEYAARAGVDGAPYPWGWDDPSGRACFASTGVVEVAGFAANRWGLYDMAGNAAEWCHGGTISRGGSWADRDPQSLRVFHRIQLPSAYRDADTGFRLIKKAGGRPGSSLDI